MSKKIDTEDKFKALLQWCVVAPIIAIGIFFTMILGWAVILTAKRQPENPFGLKSPQYHSDRYTKLGSSGVWYYVATKVPVLKWFGNFEDGLYREPSGKNSAACGGRERTFLQQYLWLIRNPFNYAKRNTPVLACFVNECTVISRGDETLNDKSRDGTGWHWVIAVHRDPKWWHWTKYYGYRQVFMWDDIGWYMAVTTQLAKIPKVQESWFRDRVCNISLGYKLKPSHGEIVQPEDDRDKALTFRVQLAKKGEWVWKGK